MKKLGNVFQNNEILILVEFNAKLPGTFWSILTRAQAQTRNVGLGLTGPDRSNFNNSANSNQILLKFGMNQPYGSQWVLTFFHKT